MSETINISELYEKYKKNLAMSESERNIYYYELYKNTYIKNRVNILLGLETHYSYENLCSFIEECVLSSAPYFYNLDWNINYSFILHTVKKMVETENKYSYISQFTRIFNNIILLLECFLFPSSSKRICESIAIYYEAVSRLKNYSQSEYTRIVDQKFYQILCSKFNDDYICFENMIKTFCADELSTHIHAEESILSSIMKIAKEKIDESEYKKILDKTDLYSSIKKMTIKKNLLKSKTKSMKLFLYHASLARCMKNLNSQKRLLKRLYFNSFFSEEDRVQIYLDFRKKEDLNVASFLLLKKDV